MVKLKALLCHRAANMAADSKSLFYLLHLLNTQVRVEKPTTEILKCKIYTLNIYTFKMLCTLFCIFCSSEDSRISVHCWHSCPGWILWAGGKRGNWNEGDLRVCMCFLFCYFCLFVLTVCLCPWQGKGCHKTYWLLSKDGFNPPVITHNPPPADSLKLQTEVPLTHITVVDKDRYHW